MIVAPDDKAIQRQAPLLKWAGGKRAIAHEILPLLNATCTRYFEPFLGGGAVFFAFNPKAAVISDLNSELIECYREVRDRTRAVANHLATMRNSESDYYRVRALIPRSGPQRAARLIYLTSLSFNGIYRQNLAGKFNVPYGYKERKKLPTFEELCRVAAALKSAELRVGDFEAVTASASRGDVIYFDPPYTVAHSNNGFVKYNAKIFSWEDQRRLAAHARCLAARGCRVIISNADHSSIDELYVGFKSKSVPRPSVIAASGSRRSVVTEKIFFL